MRYVLQQRKSEQLFSNACIRLLIYQSQNFIRCNVATTILNRRYIGVSCEMSMVCACEVYETSSNLPFACSSLKCAIFTYPFTQIATSLSLGKPGWGGDGKKKPFKNALFQAPKFGLSISVDFGKNAL